MKKGSLVRLKQDEAFDIKQIIMAYKLGILLPTHGQILTLKEDPKWDTCICGSPSCPNGWYISFEEYGNNPHNTFSKHMFEEVQPPNSIHIDELFEKPSSH